jgi:hypothetical protein
MKLRVRLSYANVVSTIALAAAVAGGSVAVAGKGGRDVTAGGKIRAGHVTAKDLAPIRLVTGSGNASCQDKERLIGGGAEVIQTDGVNQPALVESKPNPDPPGAPPRWETNAIGISRGYALCLSAKPRK